jgi:hypothetical protein
MSVAGITAALCLSGCATSGQRPVTSQPSPLPARSTVVAVSTPTASRPPSVARPIMVEQVVPAPNDAYIVAAARSDIVFVGGSTYIWVTGPDGRRHRHFYGHGDRRIEVYRRRENLRSVAPPRLGHPTPHYAAHEEGHAGRAAHRPQQVRVKGSPAHGHPPQHHVAFNNQTHQSAQHSQNVPKHT